jgi:hypothetical protein
MRGNHLIAIFSIEQNQNRQEHQTNPEKVFGETLHSKPNSLMQYSHKFTGRSKPINLHPTTQP